MVDVRPLVLRLVQQAWADRVSSPAHDALTPHGRRAHLALNPDSYMAVTRGLEDVDDAEEVTADELLLQGREALDRLRQSGAFCHELGDDFYVYQLDDRGITQRALIAGVSVADYNNGNVRIHERVKANRAIHLANHLDVVGVQSSPIAMAHRTNPAVSAITARAAESDPLVHVTLPDGLTQTVWAITDPADHATLLTTFEDEPLYLIDGHHRAAAAATFRTASGPGMADWMLSAIFAADELHNAPHHRVIRPEGGVEDALRAIGRRRRLRHCERDEIDQRADDEVALFAHGSWYCVTLPFLGDVLGDLDPSRLQSQLVWPLFHLDPEGDDPALTYLAGDRTLEELEAAAGDGILAMMRQVPIEALITAADEGLVMPPKSTYFEPKVRSGVFIRATVSDECD